MSVSNNQPGKNRRQYLLNLTLAAVVSQVGCLALVIIFVALFAGLWLDNRLSSRPLFTIGLMIGSVPVTLAAIFWVVRAATSRLQTNIQPQKTVKKEETSSGRDS